MCNLVHHFPILKAILPTIANLETEIFVEICGRHNQWETDMDKISDLALDLGLFALEIELEDRTEEQHRVPFQLLPAKICVAEMQQMER